VQEVEPVQIDDEDGRTTGATGRDMEVTILELAAGKPRHLRRR
jgi:hypothetical protein